MVNLCQGDAPMALIVERLSWIDKSAWFTLSSIEFPEEMLSHYCLALHIVFEKFDTSLILLLCKLFDPSALRPVGIFL